MLGNRLQQRQVAALPNAERPGNGGGDQRRIVDRREIDERDTAAEPGVDVIDEIPPPESPDGSCRCRLDP